MLEMFRSRFSTLGGFIVAYQSDGGSGPVAVIYQQLVRRVAQGIVGSLSMVVPSTTRMTGQSP